MWFVVNGLNNLHRMKRIIKRCQMRSPTTDFCQKSVKLRLPGDILFREFRNLCLRRTHFRLHAVGAEFLDPIASAQAPDLEFAGLCKNLEIKKVFPFGAARMQKSQTL